MYVGIVIYFHTSQLGSAIYLSYNYILTHTSILTYAYDAKAQAPVKEEFTHSG